MAFFTMKRYFSYIVLSLSVLIYSGCGSDEVEEVNQVNEVEFSSLFENIADNIIIPRYLSFQAELSALQDKLNDLDTNDSETIVAFQNQFRSTYLNWQTISVFEFGPAAEFSALLRDNINSFPTEVDKIEYNIELGEYNLSSASNYFAKGLPAIDYLFFHAPLNEIAIELSDSSRLSYVSNCIDDMVTRLDGVILGWDSYRSIFVQSQGNDQSSSLSLLFNYFLYDYEQIKRNKFALPAGFATSFGIPISADTSIVEARFSKISLELIGANLNALEKIYLGVGEDGVDRVGIYEKLKEYNAQSTVVEGDLADAIQDQFLLCKNSVSDFNNSLPYEIINNISQVQEVSNELQKMVPMIKNDMRSYLSVTVTIGDSDGD